MIDKILGQIESAEFEADVVASTPTALRELLRRRPEVHELPSSTMLASFPMKV